jgi:hypothetical protein
MRGDITPLPIRVHGVGCEAQGRRLSLCFVSVMTRSTLMTMTVQVCERSKLRLADPGVEGISQFLSPSCGSLDPPDVGNSVSDLHWPYAS